MGKHQQQTTDNLERLGLEGMQIKSGHSGTKFLRMSIEVSTK